MERAVERVSDVVAVEETRPRGGRLSHRVCLANGPGVGLTRHRGDNDNNAGDRGKHLSRRNDVWRPEAGVSWQIILGTPWT